MSAPLPPRAWPSPPGLSGLPGVRTGLGSILKSLIWRAAGELGWVRGPGSQSWLGLGPQFPHLQGIIINPCLPGSDEAMEQEGVL